MSTTTIGDVLNRLRDEFDDITISKIRFLESEGLIKPDRTDSGYRKFTDADIERLRYVLRAQRDRYLPLKVIKEELDRIDAGLPGTSPEPATTPGSAAPESAAPESAAPESAAPESEAPADPDAQPSLMDAPMSDVLLSDPELASAAGLDDGALAALRDHGLLGSAPHDGGALKVASAAAKLLAIGLEVRHLRMYRQFAEREAALIEQRVAPLLRQRNPDSRRRAVESAEELVALGRDLQRRLLTDTLEEFLRA